MYPAKILRQSSTHSQSSLYSTSAPTSDTSSLHSPYEISSPTSSQSVDYSFRSIDIYAKNKPSNLLYTSLQESDFTTPSTDYKPSNTSMIQQNATLFDYPNVAPSLSDASSPFQNNIPHSVLMENPGTSFWESSPSSLYTQAYSHPDLPTKQKKGQTYPFYECISFFLASIRSQFLY